MKVTQEMIQDVPHNILRKTVKSMLRNAHPGVPVFDYLLAQTDSDRERGVYTVQSHLGPGGKVAIKMKDSANEVEIERAVSSNEHLNAHANLLSVEKGMEDDDVLTERVTLVLNYEFS